MEWEWRLARTDTQTLVKTVEKLPERTKHSAVRYIRLFAPIHCGNGSEVNTRDRRKEPARRSRGCNYMPAALAGRLSGRLSAWFNSRTTGRIRMKFGTCVAPVNPAIKHPTMGSNKTADRETVRCCTLVAEFGTTSEAKPNSWNVCVCLCVRTHCHNCHGNRGKQCNSLCRGYDGNADGSGERSGAEITHVQWRNDRRVENAIFWWS
jgi:hypothetical protein